MNPLSSAVLADIHIVAAGLGDLQGEISYALVVAADRASLGLGKKPRFDIRYGFGTVDRNREFIGATPFHSG